MARRCHVCGLRTDRAICQRCDTILRPDRAFCPRCRKTLDSWIALCDECGAAIHRPPSPGDPEAVRALAAVPGITEAQAKDLVAHGFHDFADIVRLALPEDAVRHGLHKAIARKMMRSDLEGPSTPEATDARCPMCSATWIAGSARCVVCGSASDLALDPTGIEQKLHELTGEVVDLGADEDFQNLPEDIRRDLLQAFGGLTEEGLVREEAGPQLEAWRGKGFDVVRLDPHLEDDLNRLRETIAAMVQEQGLEKAEGARNRCPLCEGALESTAEECENCGARFE